MRVARFLGGITTLTGLDGLDVNVGSGAFNAAAAVSIANGPLKVAARTITCQGTVAAASATLKKPVLMLVSGASWACALGNDFGVYIVSSLRPEDRIDSTELTNSIS